MLLNLVKASDDSYRTGSRVERYSPPPAPPPPTLLIPTIMKGIVTVMIRGSASSASIVLRSYLSCSVTKMTKAKDRMVIIFH